MAWAKRARAVSVGRKRGASHSIVVVGNNGHQSSSEPSTPTTFVTPLPNSNGGYKRSSEVDLEKGQESLGMGLPQQQQHHHRGEAPTMIVTAEMAQQMGMGGGNGTEDIPTMAAHGQDVGGMLPPASTGEG